MRHDLRDALRTIVRSPSYSIVTIAVLALGIGATSAIFSFVDGVLLRPLPYADPDRIVMVWEKPPGGTRNSVSTENFRDWQRSNDVFDVMVALTGSGVSMSGATEPTRVRGARASAGYFEIFGVRPALGRTFASDEDELGKDEVAVITHRLWQRAFGAIRPSSAVRSCSIASRTPSSASCPPGRHSIAAPPISGVRSPSRRPIERGTITGCR